MRLRTNNCCALLVDFQDRIIAAMEKKEQLLSNTLKLAKGLSLLGVPIMITEQYPKGLGKTLPEVKEAAVGAPVFEKTAFGALSNEDLLGHLEQLEESGRDYVLICGIEAHVCALQTALQLSKKGFKPVLVTDCLASRHSSDYMAALMRAEHEGMAFVSAEMLLFELLGGKEHPRFKEISALLK